MCKNVENFAAGFDRMASSEILRFFFWIKICADFGPRHFDTKYCQDEIFVCFGGFVLELVFIEALPDDPMFHVYKKARYG